MRRVLPLVVLVALLGAACGSDPTTGADGLRVVATTTILGDVVSEIVGDAGTVEVFMQPGQDPHAFSPSARQAQLLRRADLVVMNGLDLEASLTDALDAAASDGVPILRFGEQVDPRRFDDRAEFDPHVWMDPLRMRDGVDVVAARIAAVDTAHDRSFWQGRGDAVAATIQAAHDEVTQILSAVPTDRRVLVTNHDALGYFADRYGFEIVGTVIPGISTQAAADAADFAALATTIRDRGVPAIFAETTSSTALADALAGEVGRDVAVVALYTGSLGPPDSGADTYVGMLETDARRIADALAP